MASTSVGMLGRSAITYATQGIPKGSVFFLHGTCDTGPGLKSWVRKVMRRDFEFKEYHILYPTSPIRKYTLLNGQDVNVWYDRLSPGPNMPEDKLSIDQVGEHLSEVIRQEEVLRGKVIVGGFSMGGSMALHMGYRFNQSVAGVFALSSFLPADSAVFSDVEDFVARNPQLEPDDSARRISKNGRLLNGRKAFVPERKLPQLFMSLGKRDPLVKSSWTQATFDRLKEFGVQGHLYTFPNQSHEITSQQLQVLHNWIEETLTDQPKPKISEDKPFHVNDEGTLPAPKSWLKFWGGKS